MSQKARKRANAIGGRLRADLHMYIHMAAAEDGVRDVPAIAEAPGV